MGNTKTKIKVPHELKKTEMYVSKIREDLANGMHRRINIEHLQVLADNVERLSQMGKRHEAACKALHKSISKAIDEAKLIRSQRRGNSLVRKTSSLKKFNLATDDNIRRSRNESRNSSRDSKFKNCNAEKSVKTRRESTENDDVYTNESQNVADKIQKFENCIVKTDKEVSSDKDYSQKIIKSKEGLSQNASFIQTEDATYDERTYDTPYDTTNYSTTYDTIYDTPNRTTNDTIYDVPNCTTYDTTHITTDDRTHDITYASTYHTTFNTTENFANKSDNKKNMLQNDSLIEIKINRNDEALSQNANCIQTNDTSANCASKNDKELLLQNANITLQTDYTSPNCSSKTDKDNLKHIKKLEDSDTLSISQIRNPQNNFTATKNDEESTNILKNQKTIKIDNIWQQQNPQNNFINTTTKDSKESNHISKNQSVVTSPGLRKDISISIQEKINNLSIISNRSNTFIPIKPPRKHLKSQSDETKNEITERNITEEENKTKNEITERNITEEENNIGAESYAERRAKLINSFKNHNEKIRTDYTSKSNFNTLPISVIEEETSPTKVGLNNIENINILTSSSSADVVFNTESVDFDDTSDSSYEQEELFEMVDEGGDIDPNEISDECFEQEELSDECEDVEFENMEEHEHMLRQLTDIENNLKIVESKAQEFDGRYEDDVYTELAMELGDVQVELLSIKCGDSEEIKQYRRKLLQCVNDCFEILENNTSD